MNPWPLVKISSVVLEEGFCCIQVVLNSDTQVERKSVLPLFLFFKGFCCIQVVLNSDTQVELKSVLPLLFFKYIRSIAQSVTVYHCVCADMSTLNEHQLLHIVSEFVFRHLHWDDWQPHVTVSVFVVSCPHWMDTDIHTLSLGLCSNVYTEWLLTASCNYCIIVFVVSRPHWMDTDIHTLSLGLCSDIYRVIINNLT